VRVAAVLCLGRCHGNAPAVVALLNTASKERDFRFQNLSMAQGMRDLRDHDPEGFENKIDGGLVQNEQWELGSRTRNR